MNDNKNAWLQKLGAKWEQLQGSIKEKFADARIESDLEGKMDRFKKKLDEAKEVGEDRVEELKNDLEAAWDDMQSATDRLKSGKSED